MHVSYSSKDIVNMVDDSRLMVIHVLLGHRHLLLVFWLHRLMHVLQ